jgi:S1-C subfamily serine protease
MSGIVRYAAACLLVAFALAGCVGKRDVALGNDRYMISIPGSRFLGIGVAEQNFHKRAQEIAAAHGFDSYKVIEFRSGFEPSPGGGLDPYAKGTIQLYQSARNVASGAPGGDAKGALTSGRRASGTAFAVAAGGLLVTNAHVVHECRDITVRQGDGTVLPATLLAADQVNDLALIKVASPTTSDPALFRGSPDIRQGENVVAIGFPLSYLLSAGSATTLTTGTVSALAGVKGDSRLLQVSAPIQPGNSGGPLLDQSGHVVAIVSSSLNAVKLAATQGIIPENVNFAIKTSVVRAFMDANGVAYRVAASERPLPTAEIGDQARRFTHFVMCTS